MELTNLRVSFEHAAFEGKMRHRVFGKIQASLDVVWLRNSFSKLFGMRQPRGIIGAADTSRTLAGNADYDWETVVIDAIGRSRERAKSPLHAGCVGADRDLVWTGIDRLLRLNGRYRLSC